MGFGRVGGGGGGFQRLPLSENRNIEEENLGKWALDRLSIIWGTSGSEAVLTSHQ